MSDVYTDGGSAYSNLLAAGYDRFLEFQLRSQPVFRQVVDKHPVDVTNPGPTVTLSIVQEFAALATTPLSETSDVAAVAPPNPDQVTVTLHEYGNADVATLRLRQLAFTAPEPAIANVLGKNMVDTIDKLVETVLDGGTHILGYNGSATVVSESTGFAEGSVAATDKLTSELIRDGNALLRRRNAHGRDAMDTYMGLIHPDVVVDILSDSGWLAPHNYVDPQNLYNAEIGQYLGVRFVQTPRTTKAADGASSAEVYTTYLLGAQAVVEAVVSEPHIVIGPQTDRLRRFFPIGWLAHLGWSIYRDEAIQLLKTSSSIAAL